MVKLNDLANKMPKEYLYDKYCRLVYDPRSYQNITRKQILDEIVREYNDITYSLYSLCTERELKLLNILYNHPNSTIKREKYHWEIEQLVNKLIIDYTTLEIYDEQRDNVKIALQRFADRPHKGEDEIAAFVIGLLRAYAELPEKSVIDMTSGAAGLEPEQLKQLLGNNPLIHFYVGVRECDTKESILHGEWLLFLYDYIDIIEDILDTRKRLNVTPGAKGFNDLDYLDMFYYGTPLRYKSTKQFYKTVSTLDDHQQNFIFSTFDEARVFFDEDLIKTCSSEKPQLQEVQELMQKAWENTPSPSLCGLTPKEWRKEEKLQRELDVQFIVESQKHACLSEAEADEYYELYFALLEYVNNQKHVSPKVKRIFRQEHLDPLELQPIDEYLWSHKKMIDRFVQENPYDFTDDMLKTIAGFKKAIHRDMLTIIGFEKEYTKIFSADDQKVYMVKGVRGNFDALTPKICIPLIIKTTLLNFKGQIIYSGFFSSYNFDLGTGWKKCLLTESAQAEICYEL